MSALHPMVLPGPVLWGLRERGVLQRAGTVGFPWRVCGRFNFDFERGDATRESLTKLVFEEVSFCLCFCFCFCVLVIIVACRTQEHLHPTPVTRVPAFLLVVLHLVSPDLLLPPRAV